MAKKIAAAIIHGIGTPESDFADEMIAKLKKEFHRITHRNPDDYIVFQPVWWADIFDAAEQDLLHNTNAELQKKGIASDWPTDQLRRFIINSLADAVAYQPLANADSPREPAPELTRGLTRYHSVHKRIDKALHYLRQHAGADAPLCVISHSLGSVIASNYFYDLQRENSFRCHVPSTPLEKGETLALFYTLGSPMALWSLRKPGQFDSTIQFHASGGGGKPWINLYDPGDIIAYPLQQFDAYNKIVEDRPVNVGSYLSKGTPLSHTKYWDDPKIIEIIALGLAKLAGFHPKSAITGTQSAKVRTGRILLKGLIGVPALIGALTVILLGILIGILQKSL